MLSEVVGGISRGSDASLDVLTSVAMRKKQNFMYRKVRSESYRCAANLLKVEEFAANLLRTLTI